MSVDLNPVITSNVSFRAKTEEENNYKKSKIGKLLGTLGGAGYGAYSCYASNKNMTQLDKFISSAPVKAAIEKGNIEEFKTLFQKAAFSKKYQKQISKLIESFGTNSKEFSNIMSDYTIINVGKKFRTPMVVIGIAFLTLLGLGVGAIADGIINSVKRNKADEQAEKAQKA